MQSAIVRVEGIELYCKVAYQGDWHLQCATDPVLGGHVVDDTAKLVGNEIADNRHHYIGSFLSRLTLKDLLEHAACAGSAGLCEAAAPVLKQSGRCRRQLQIRCSNLPP